MTQEHDTRRIPLTGIHIDSKERSIRFDAEDRTLGTLIFEGETVLFEAPHLPAHEPAAVLPPAPEPASLESGGPINPSEKEETVTLVGKLLSRPKAGKVDRSGNPTAWARLAVHEEGRRDAHLYLATFHRHTARIALGLRRDAHVIVEGYPHESQSEGRLDTLSVVTFVAYPGKSQRRTS